MLAISTRKIAELVLLRHEFPGAEPDFRGIVEALNEDEAAELVAVMWIGRGSFEPEDLAEAIATARAEATGPTADYLIGTPHVAEHLEAGLEALGVDVEAEEEEAEQD